MVLHVISNAEIAVCTYGLGVDAKLDELRELLLECILIRVTQGCHIGGNVLAKDVVAVDACVEVLCLTVIAGEPLHAAEHNQL